MASSENDETEHTPHSLTIGQGAGSSRPLMVLAIGLFTVASALALLAITSANPGIVFGPDRATTLLAVELIAITLLLAMVSLGGRIRITLQMILIYLTIYMVLPGYSHSSANQFPFFGMSYAHDIRMTAAVMISVFVIALMVGYVLAEQTDRIGRRRKTLGREILFPNQVLLTALTIGSLASAVAYLGFVGVGLAFSTRAEFGAVQGSIAENGLFVTTPRVITFMSLAYAYTLFLRGRNKGTSIYYVLLNALPFFVTNYPFVLPRFTIFGIILFFAMQTFDFRAARARAILTVAFLFGALFAMPYVNSLTRAIGTETATTLEGAYGSYLSSGDFDGLQSMQNAVIYTEREGYRNGIQLLSSVLFFVPRDLWSGKAQATGEMTSRAAGYAFNNISQPLPSEFYVDFGMAGMALITFVLGFWVARLDGWIDRNWQNGPRARLIAGVVVAYTIIFMRGSLLGIISPVLTFAAGVYLIIRFGLVRPESIRIRRKPRINDKAALSPRAARHARAVSRTR